MIPLLLLAILLLPHHNFFIEYKVITYFASDGKTIYGYIIENITNIFPNGTVKYEFYLLNENYSQYIGPIVIYDNLSSPKSLYYFPQVGQPIVQRGNLTFQLIENQSGCYVYENIQHVTSVVKVITYIYVNKSKVPSKIEFLQYGLSGFISNNTYVLFSSNLINLNSTIYFPSNYTKVSNGGVIGSGSLNYAIQNVIVSSLVILIPIIFLFKLLSKKKYGKNI